MIRLVTDSSALYNSKEAADLGFDMCPLSVTIGEKSWLELDEITTEQLIYKILNEGAIPTSSQPPIGNKIDVYNKYLDEDEIIDIAMADGLSGTYQSAVMAKNDSEHPDKVHVFNSRTLCGPHRAMVQEALAMIKEGASLEEILTMLMKSRDHEISYLIPKDFDYLLRNGRLDRISATIGGLLNLTAAVKKTPDGKRLTKFTKGRTEKKVVRNVAADMRENGVDSTYKFYISHADNPDFALLTKKIFMNEFPEAYIEILPLSPVFTTQGGPACMSIQAIKIIR